MGEPCARCALLEAELRRTQARLAHESNKVDTAMMLVEETNESIDKLIARILELWDGNKF